MFKIRYILSSIYCYKIEMITHCNTLPALFYQRSWLGVAAVIVLTFPHPIKGKKIENRLYKSHEPSLTSKTNFTSVFQCLKKGSCALSLLIIFIINQNLFHIYLFKSIQIKYYKIYSILSTNWSIFILLYILELKQFFKKYKMQNLILCLFFFQPVFFFWFAAKFLTFFKYSSLFVLYSCKGSCWAGLSIFGSSFNSFWTPNKICLTVIFAFQSYSSFRIDKHTVPDG